MKAISLIMGLFLAISSQAIEKERIYSGDTTREVSLDEVLDRVEKGTVIVVSEFHGFAPHHEHQVGVIEGLKQRGWKVNVGMEFIDFTQQGSLDNYLSGKLTEFDFLSEIGWGGIPYENYKRQVLGSVGSQGWTFGLNAPRTLSGKIARSGLGSLSPDELKLIPPNFTLGNDLYFQRFQEVMGGHVSPEKLERYFTAQSLWDETSAWNIINIMETRKEEVMVVIFGDFHNSYGGGLPDRLKARGYSKVLTISQVDLAGLTADEIREVVAPHKKYGPRADYVWTSERESSSPSEISLMTVSQPLEDIVQFGSVLGIRRLH